ncbi:hypothetical protein PHJA_001882100 [Phtheirospermum japonicum]|uniref:DUF4408 domain-containing protein n=1 Tax=Phtheirospermum japonicum TaxID=374723 RepID=A0A830CCN9_9LAMI|nr:hypothetical protein PHJA_001882100 [Phtheirospermum japonicum]
MNNWIIYMKVLLLSAGAACLAVVIKSTVPVLCSDVVSSWLKPPYLYILVNAIIITIAASSRFHRIQSGPHDQSHDHHLISVKTPPPSDFTSSSFTTLAVEPPPAEYEGGEIVVELRPVIVNGLQVLADAESLTAPETLLSAAAVREEPLVSSRSGHRKPIRSTSHRNGVRTPKVAKHETLDSIWKKITEGAPRATHEIPQEVRRKLVARLPPPDCLVDHVPKSKSAKERRSKDPLRIRSEPSLSQDELNRRAEAFIKKVNEEMRLERETLLDKM